MKIIIATGGTGGHIFTGLAIAEEVESLGASVIIVGSKFGMEKTIVPRCFKLRTISQKPLLGKGLIKKVGFPFFLILSLIESLHIIVNEHPNGVIGTGGFGSFSPVFIASLLGIPTIITEVDSIPGLTTRLLSRFVKEIWLSFEIAKKKLPGVKVKVAGFPVRREITVTKKTLKDFGLTPGLPTILVFGGSRGASSINEIFSRTIPLLSRDFQFIWQVGAELKLRTYQITNCKLQNVWMAKFIDDMGSAYGNSQLVVSRAGALTIGELTAVGLPAILVPYPYATQNHQLLNAKFLEKMGAAKIILDKDLNPNVLANAIKSITGNPGLRNQMSQAAKRLGTTGIARRIAERIIELCSGI